MKRFTGFAVAVLVVLLFPGCRSSSTGDEIEITSAPIHEVNVNIAESAPPQVIVYIKGGLPDGCTKFHELKTERRGNTFKITVTNERPRDAVCTQIYGYFEKNENLGTDFVPGENYVVNVNDKTTGFIVP